MVKPLVFKGDNKPKKRKRTTEDSTPSKSSRTANANPDQSPSDAPEVVINPESDDSWVNVDRPEDINGPLLIVLPGARASALSCDATGKVFALEIENIVDGNRSSAEPHDVRQVWVANKVAGTENYRLKGAHGRFLSCSPSGALNADSEAVSSLESFTIVPDATSGTFHIRTTHGRYLSSTTIKSESGTTKVHVRGDSDTSGSDDTTVWLRMQARFKPRVRTEKEERMREKVGRRDLEKAVGRKLEDDEVRRLKRARREGDYHEQLLMLKAKGKHDKYSY